MKYRRLDGNGDYSLGGRNNLLDAADAVGQALVTRLLLLRGEWWENIEDGLPLREEILGSYRGEDEIADIDLLIAERVNDTEGVSEITTFESTFNARTRTYSASITVQTIFEQDIQLEIGKDVSYQTQRRPPNVPATSY